MGWVMSIDWQIFAAAFGAGAFRAALFEYGDWKAKRTEIPLDFNPRTGAFEPDLKLKRWERAAKVALWALVAWLACFFVVLVIGSKAYRPQTPDIRIEARQTSRPTGSD